VLLYPGARTDEEGAGRARSVLQNSEVVEITIELGKNELDSLRRDARKYVKATLKVGERVYKDVGIHSRGRPAASAASMTGRV